VGDFPIWNNFPIWNQFGIQFGTSNHLNLDNLERKTGGVYSKNATKLVMDYIYSGFYIFCKMTLKIAFSIVDY